VAHSYFAVYIHAVWSTKERQPWITPATAVELYPYLASAVRGQECRAVEVGGHRDHVHLLIGMAKSILVPDLVKEIKRSTTAWMKEREPQFAWQEGYGAFSVSVSNLETVRGYIRNQEAHHATMTWETEFRQLLVKHGITFDERFYLG